MVFLHAPHLHSALRASPYQAWEHHGAGLPMMGPKALQSTRRVARRAATVSKALNSFICRLGWHVPDLVAASAIGLRRQSCFFCEAKHETVGGLLSFFLCEITAAWARIARARTSCALFAWWTDAGVLSLFICRDAQREGEVDEQHETMIPQWITKGWMRPGAAAILPGGNTNSQSSITSQDHG